MGMQARSDPAGCAATKLSRGRGRLAIGAAARGRRDPFKACGRRRRRRSRLVKLAGRARMASRAGPLGIEVQRLRHHEQQTYTRSLAQQLQKQHRIHWQRPLRACLHAVTRPGLRRKSIRQRPVRACLHAVTQLGLRHRSEKVDGTLELTRRGLRLATGAAAPC